MRIVLAEVLAAIADVQEDIRIHHEWRACLRAYPDHDFGQVGDVAHHEQWIARYERVLRILRATADRLRSEQAEQQSADFLFGDRGVRHLLDSRLPG
jgi:hypothetical protein